MKSCVVRIVDAALWSAVVTAAAAELPVWRVQEIRTGEFNLRNGRIANASQRQPSGLAPVWSATHNARYFTSVPAAQIDLDWGDVPDGSEVDAISIGYATNSPQPVDLDLLFYTRENGFQSSDRVLAQVFRFRDLPGGDPNRPAWYLGWILTVELDDPNDDRSFALAGPDLEGGPDDGPCPFRPGCTGFGLADFGYSFNFTNVAEPFVAGPLLADVDPNAAPCAAPGTCADSTWVDIFRLDPNASPPEPNALLIPEVSTEYIGTFGPHTHAFELYMQLSERRTLGDQCPNFQVACAVADLNPAPGLPFGGGDCVVDLGDLSVLLANFGATSGATFAAGDIDPPLNLDTLAVGDGDVDLADLSRLLAAFGTDCR